MSQTATAPEQEATGTGALGTAVEPPTAQPGAAKDEALPPGAPEVHPLGESQMAPALEQEADQQHPAAGAGAAREGVSPGAEEAALQWAGVADAQATVPQPEAGQRAAQQGAVPSSALVVPQGEERAPGQDPPEPSADVPRPDQAQQEGAARSQGGGPPGRGLSEAELRFKDQMSQIGGCLISMMSLVLLICLGLSGGWQRHVVTAQPYSVYSVYRTVVSIVPNENGEATVPPQNRRWQSKTPEPIFEVWAGLSHVRIPSLCDPQGDTFDAAVDRQHCNAKLEAFCRSLKQDTPVGDLQAIAEHSFQQCLSAVSHGGITIPLLTGPMQDVVDSQASAGPPPSAVQLGSRGDSQSELDEELSDNSLDVQPNFCRTVGNCDMLAEIRPYCKCVMAILFSAIFVVLISGCLHGLACYWQSEKLSLTGWHVYLLGIVLAIAAVSVYMHSTNKFPADQLIKKEELFYFLLPGSFTPPTSQVDDVVQAEEPGKALLQLGEEMKVKPLVLEPTGRTWRSEDQQKGASLVGEQQWDQGHMVPGLIRTGEERWTDVPSSVLALQQDRLPSAQKVQSETPEASEAASSSSSSSNTGRASTVPTIPFSKWQGAVFSIVGELTEAMEEDNWDAFFDKLKDALSHSWRIAHMVFTRWVYYAEKNLARSPQDGESLLNALLEGARELDKVEATCKQIGAECEMDQHSALRAEAAAELEEVLKISVARRTTALNLIKTVKDVLVGIVDVWNTAGEPVKRLVAAIREIVSRYPEDGESSAKLDLAKAFVNQQLTKDMSALFNSIFVKLPYAMANIRMVGRQWLALIQRMDVYLARLARAMRLTHRLVVELLKKAPSETLARSEKILMDLRMKTLSDAAGFWTTLPMEVSNKDKHLFELKRELDFAYYGDISVGISTQAPTTSSASNASSLVLLGEISSFDAAPYDSDTATSFMERLQSRSLVAEVNANGGLAKQIEPFVTGGLSNPSSRLGIIFLDQLGTMREKTGFAARAPKAECSVGSLLTCQPYSHAFFLFWITVLAMLALYVRNTLGFWEKVQDVVRRADEVSSDDEEGTGEKKLSQGAEEKGPGRAAPGGSAPVEMTSPLAASS